MNGREFNKISASILLSALVIMLTSKIVDVLYAPDLHPPRAYSVKIDETSVPASDEPQNQEFTIDIKSLLEKASSEAGKALSVKCIACHTLNKGGQNRVGPNLWGIVGRKKASEAGYTYSTALSSLGGEWDEESLAKYLHKPQAYAKGTKMGFVGFSKQTDLADMIAFLKTLKD
ncbi:MAG: cytochrome c family protein [Rickettsiaceae bacterium]|nr:cytochrome c family protein [Rickettsiaceae bacterium]